MEDTLSLFLKKLKYVGVRALIARDRAELDASVAEVLKDSPSIYCPRETELEASITIPEAQACPEYATAFTTIEEVPAAIAETGSLVLWSAAGRVVQSSLLPPRHVALVRRENLFRDVDEFLASLSGPLPTNITLATGPSRTADIEQTLITGVHGPEIVDVIVFGPELL